MKFLICEKTKLPKYFKLPRRKKKEFKKAGIKASFTFINEGGNDNNEKKKSAIKSVLNSTYRAFRLSKLSKGQLKHVKGVEIYSK